MSEHEPMFRIPTACGALLFLILIVHMLQVFGGFDFTAYSVQPDLFRSAPFAPQHFMTLLTYQFLHANWMHLGMNSAMLLAFGSAMARITGGKIFILIYLICGIIAALAHIGVYADHAGYLIGASGAVSGAMGFVLWRVMRDPRARLKMLLVIAISQPVMALAGGAWTGGEIAWLAHLAGFAAGIGFALALKKE